MKRILLFLVTNIAILLVLNITLRLLGVDRILDDAGGLNFNALLIFAAVVGFGGSFISLALVIGSRNLPTLLGMPTIGSSATF